MLLSNLSSQHPTDKFNLGYVDEFYQKYFESKKETAEAVLEIGIYEGNSIMLWHDYFQNARIYGLDIASRPNKCNISSDRLVIFDRMNAYTESMVSQIQEKEPSGFDVIIDDGPHTLETMEFFVENYLPLTKKGGLFIVEDIIDLQWTPILEEKIKATTAEFAPNSNCIKYDMRNKQKVDGLRNRWSVGLDVLLVEVR